MSSPTLTDKVSKMIYQDILNGDLIPGQKLVVAELKERYHVGASPIREALVQLSWNKYVTLEPQKGCWVASISEAELKDLFEGLRIVGKVLLEKSISNGDEAWELNILTSFHKLSKVSLEEPSVNVIKEWEDRHSAFHSALIEGANAPIMYKFHQELTNQIKRYHHLQSDNQSIYKAQINYLEDHEALMKLALSRNSNRSVELLDNYYLKTMDMLSASFSA
ncbi:GntR family transcriptional regulator [Aliivibrio sp. S4TY2]|uniref:GntR family transcriptional regulator n=1 Tax=unclassified Aliivibrio TaxID=2645654 RepID=UPI0023780196|nr:MULTISPECIES: GntR family transcriptional regulator [unclassified Aliivibrio]MDD9155823.1 GntR family transcriptional regulator [Aliivibrio sp. S4TY2]MDD9159497.1 GntR family transcriptional regulator [Aliivibrio sp. S4TY1]MDD9163531.1 GntR family transcriptional regulator [Aliivibrio sp. S4MY2]MDD9167532.1 GntR family transcriptional regulator [Aliivibrio sp. S4MY4]MDD9186056.1 GntR family transcriptional regulator [Aliivibrio sp. S4MY3]